MSPVTIRIPFFACMFCLQRVSLVHFILLLLQNFNVWVLYSLYYTYNLCISVVSVCPSISLSLFLSLSPSLAPFGFFARSRPDSQVHSNVPYVNCAYNKHTCLLNSHREARAASSIRHASSINQMFHVSSFDPSGICVTNHPVMGIIFHEISYAIYYRRHVPWW